MNLLSKEKKREFQHLLATPELRSIANDVTKAAFVLQNYIGEFEFSQTEICAFFCISRQTLKNRMKAIALGHTCHSHHNTKYLAPCHERRLVDMIQLAASVNKSKALEEIPEMVLLFLI